MTSNLPTRGPLIPNGTARRSDSTGRPGSVESADSRTPSERSVRHEGGEASRPRGRRGNSNGSAQTPNSTHSSAHAPQLVTQPRYKKLRSQYPRDSQERHVEYILVASFDIDKGPIMEHQYPGAISGDENMLAELMLPDQAHVRSEDWTIFFLHKDTTEEEEAREAAREERRMAREERREARRRVAEEGHGKIEEDSDSGQDEDDEGGGGGEGPPLIYVLNLVNTKQDSSVRRGAIVKAMAICTRHPFLHIYKPLLLLALEEYFKNPYLDTLEHLYNAVNTMDLSLMPRLTLLEKNILQGSDAKDLFIEKFDQMIQQRIAEDASNTLPDSPTRQTHDLSRRGYQLPRDTHQYETHVVYNSIPIPVKVPTAVSPETVGDFSLLKLIQIFSGPHVSSPVPFALHPHLTTAGAYTHPIVVLVNAVLTQKRVVFLGHNRPSGEVAHAVLAACALASGGVLRGFTRHAFPYTDLSKIDDLLNVPGFIAGVTNPTFANHPEWWDVLCDLPTGRMKISSKIDPVSVTDGITFFQQQHPTYAPSNTGALPPATTQPPAHSTGPADPTGDIAFMDDIQRSINARHGESVIRSKFRDYVIKFTRIAAAFEEAVFGASALHAGAVEADAGAFGVSGHGYVWPDETARARELAANAWRIEGWRTTRAYYALIQDLAALWGRRPVRAIDVAHQLDRLRTLKLTKEQSARILIALRQAITGYAGVCQLLAAAPEHHAGLFYLGLGLWHPDRGAREATADLLERVKRHAAGRHAWRALGRFQHAACAKVQKDLISRKRGKSDPDPGAPDGYAAYASTSPLSGVGPMGVPGLGIGLDRVVTGGGGAGGTGASGPTGGSGPIGGSAGGAGLGMGISGAGTLPAGPATAPLGGTGGGIDSIVADQPQAQQSQPQTHQKPHGLRQRPRS